MKAGLPSEDPSALDLEALVSRRACLSEELDRVLVEIVTVSHGLSLAAEPEAGQKAESRAARTDTPKTQARPGRTDSSLTKIRQVHVARRTERIMAALDDILGGPAGEEARVAEMLADGSGAGSARDISRGLIARAGGTSDGMALEDALASRVGKVLARMKASGAVSRSGGRWVSEPRTDSGHTKGGGVPATQAAKDTAERLLGVDGGAAAAAVAMEGGESLTVREIASRILKGAGAEADDALLVDAAIWRLKETLASMEASGKTTREGQRTWKLREEGEA